MKSPRPLDIPSAVPQELASILGNADLKIIQHDHLEYYAIQDLGENGTHLRQQLRQLGYSIALGIPGFQLAFRKKRYDDQQVVEAKRAIAGIQQGLEILVRLGLMQKGIADQILVGILAAVDVKKG